MSGDRSLQALGELGLFILGPPTAEEAVEIDALGFGCIWVAGSPPADLDWAEPLLETTESLCLGTSIVNIWTADPAEVAESFHRIDSAHPNRFVLGLGPGHPELHQEYRKPLDALRTYLDELDALGVPAERRVLAAQGPQALELAAQRSAGAIPYLTTLQHTKEARCILGSDAFLAPEHKVVLSPDADSARNRGRQAITTSIQKANYRASWRRLGFTESDFADGGSAELLGAVVSHGSAEQVAQSLDEFRKAGADHVVVQMLVERADLVRSLRELAAAL